MASDLANELEELGFVKKYPDFTWKIIRNQHGAIARPVQKMGMSAIDCMEGHAFEFWCADILRKNGFIDVEVTRGSGDQGVDILAKKAGIKYAIQCKCYATDLGNKPVQEVNTGKTIYHCHVGAVMTNRYFTEGAKQAADATGVLLWNRDDVKKWLKLRVFSRPRLYNFVLRVGILRPYIHSVPVSPVEVLIRFVFQFSFRFQIPYPHDLRKEAIPDFHVI